MDSQSNHALILLKGAESWPIKHVNAPGRQPVCNCSQALTGGNSWQRGLLRAKAGSGGAACGSCLLVSKWAHSLWKTNEKRLYTSLYMRKAPGLQFHSCASTQLNQTRLREPTRYTLSLPHEKSLFCQC